MLVFVDICATSHLNTAFPLIDHKNVFLPRIYIHPSIHQSIHWLFQLILAGSLGWGVGLAILIKGWEAWHTLDRSPVIDTHSFLRAAYRDQLDMCMDEFNQFRQLLVNNYDGEKVSLVDMCTLLHVYHRHTAS